MKMRFGVLFGALAVFAFFASAAVAADTGNAAGRAFDIVTNAGVGGVTVVATCSVEYDEDQPYARIEVTTGADGSYTLRGLLANRTYRLALAKSGYMTEARYEAAIASGKTRRIADIGLCPIPANHGVYRLSDETVKFLNAFVRDPSARPAHPLVYEALPQATYTKTPVPGQEGKFTRTFTVPRETVIPQILHKHKRSPGDALLVLFNADSLPQFRRVSEAASDDRGVRRFLGGEDDALEVDPLLEMNTTAARICLFYSGASFVGAGYCNLSSGTYSFFVRSGDRIVSCLFEVVDTTTGDEATRCRNMLVIMRHEIAELRGRNGRLPTIDELGMLYDGKFSELSSCENPFLRSGRLLRNADALNLKKGTPYVEEATCWLYSPSTGEIWAATESGHGEAGW